jgi:hypothetical protein
MIFPILGNQAFHPTVVAASIYPRDWMPAKTWKYRLWR